MGLFEHSMKAIKEADVVMEILDSRFPEQTRNSEMERKILSKGKKLVFVLNKCDLIGKKKAEIIKKKLSAIAPCVFVSAQKKLGTTMLKKTIMKIASKEHVKVAAVGYPNTGKSSIINVLAGRKVARTSAQAGFTRGGQFVRIAKNIMLIDCPGIIPFEQRDEFELALVAAKSPNQLQDIEGVALQLIQWMQKENPEILEKAFGIDINEKDAEKILEEIATKKKKLAKNGKLDINAAAMLLIKNWQNGRIKDSF